MQGFVKNWINQYFALLKPKKKEVGQSGTSILYLKNIDLALSDMVQDFMYYKRKGDEELPLGAIQQAVKEGFITKEEIVERFAFYLNNSKEWDDLKAT
jgi:hypothetical protein